MKQVFYHFLLFFLLNSLHTFAFNIKDFEKQFKLLPAPQKIELFNGKGISYNSLQSIFLDGIFLKPVLYGPLKSLPRTNKAGTGVLAIKLSSDGDLPESAEGYVLEIKTEQVIL